MRRTTALFTLVAGAAVAIALNGSLAGAGFWCITALLEGATVALVWATAWGLGRLLERVLRVEGLSLPACVAVRAGGGMALLMTLLQGFGLAGLLRPVPVLILGVFGLGAALYGIDPKKSAERAREDSLLRHPLLPLVAVPGLLLLVAASVPPGVLWPDGAGDESKGYDALGYHLQIAREWLDSGRILRLPHNAYSFLPLHVEGLYSALMAARGGPFEGMLACQWLHASFALAAAALLALWCRERTDSAGAGIWGALAFLLLPGTLIVGSLAYNEMGMLFLFACAWVLLSERQFMLAGALLGTAAGVKMTAVGMVAAPVALALFLPHEPNAAPRGRSAAILVVVATLLYAPFLVRNFLWTGNPIFPMATRVLGGGNWSEVQAARWSRAHDPTGTLVERFLRFVPDGIFDSRFDPLWWLLVAVAIAGGIACARTRRGTLQAVAMVGVQIAFWAGFTHTAGRFLLPVAIPLAVCAGLGWAAFETGVSRPLARQAGWAVLLVAAVVLGVRQFTLFRAASSILGPNIAAEHLVQYVDLPHDLYAPEDLREERFLLLGEARAFYFPSGTIYNAPFEEGLFALAWRTHHGDASAVLADLAGRGVTVLYVDWQEVDRLRSTWGMDPEVNRENLAALERAGARILPEHANANIVVYRIRPR